MAGRNWNEPPKSIATVAAEGFAVINGRQPDGTFVGTTIDYTGNDVTSIVEWLAADGCSFRGVARNHSDAVVSLAGFIGVQQAGSVTFDVTEGLSMHYPLEGNGVDFGRDPFRLEGFGLAFGPGQAGQAAQYTDLSRISRSLRSA